MVAAHQEVDPPLPNQIHKSMFLRNASRPYIAAEMLQRLGLADSVEWIPHHGFHKIQDAQSRLAIDIDPVPQVLPEFVLKY
jgi:hypothetical protein